MSYSEDHLIEQPAIQLMEHELGWDSVNAYNEWSSGLSNLGREATIARANWVYGDKVNGLIVDYANVFQQLEKALAIYGSGRSGDELPVKYKTELTRR